MSNGENVHPSTSQSTKGSGIFAIFSRIFSRSKVAVVPTQALVVSEPDEKEIVVEYSGPEVSQELASYYKTAVRVGHMAMHTLWYADPSGNFPAYNITYTPPSSSAEGPEVIYSLLRTNVESEAAWTWHIYMRAFPDLIEASETPLDRQSLEDIVLMVNLYESYSGVHVAAALDMVEQLKSPVFREKLFKTEQKHLHTPLEVACIHGKFRAFRAILEADDVRVWEHLNQAMDLEGNSVVHLAAMCKDRKVGPRILKLLKQQIVKILHHTETSGGSKEESILLQKFQMRNEDGLAPIHLACMCRNLEAVVELSSLSDNSDKTDPPPSSHLLDIQTSHGYTALHYVTGQPAILSRLLSLGANPNIPDREGLTPLHRCVLTHELKATLELLVNKADPDCRVTSEDYKDSTALHLAALICDVDSIKALCIFGIDKGLKDKNGLTAKDIVAAATETDPAVKQEAFVILSVNLKGNKTELRALYRKANQQLGQVA